MQMPLSIIGMSASHTYFERGEIMGHHSKKNNQAAAAAPTIDINSLGRLLNNVDINAMSNMLNGMDINQIMSLLSNAFVSPPASPSKENINSVNETKNDIPSDSPKTINVSDIFKSFKTPEGSPTQPVLDPTLPPNDPVVIVLNSLKPFLPPDKSVIVDDMIKLLGIKSVIDTIFPNGQVRSSKTDKNLPVDDSSSEVKETLN